MRTRVHPNFLFFFFLISLFCFLRWNSLQSSGKGTKWSRITGKGQRSWRTRRREKRIWTCHSLKIQAKQKSKMCLIYSYTGQQLGHFWEKVCNIFHLSKGTRVRCVYATGFRVVCFSLGALIKASTVECSFNNPSTALLYMRYDPLCLTPYLFSRAYHCFCIRHSTL